MFDSFYGREIKKHRMFKSPILSNNFFNLTTLGLHLWLPAVAAFDRLRKKVVHGALTVSLELI
jgi:hypothetical protein